MQASPTTKRFVQRKKSLKFSEVSFCPLIGLESPFALADRPTAGWLTDRWLTDRPSANPDDCLLLIQVYIVSNVSVEIVVAKAWFGHLSWLSITSFKTCSPINFFWMNHIAVKLIYSVWINRLFLLRLSKKKYLWLISLPTSFFGAASYF